MPVAVHLSGYLAALPSIHPYIRIHTHTYIHTYIHAANMAGFIDVYSKTPINSRSAGDTGKDGGEEESWWGIPVLAVTAAAGPTQGASLWLVTSEVRQEAGEVFIICGIESLVTGGRTSPRVTSCDLWSRQMATRPHSQPIRRWCDWLTLCNARRSVVSVHAAGGR